MLSSYCIGIFCILEYRKYFKNSAQQFIRHHNHSNQFKHIQCRFVCECVPCNCSLIEWNCAYCHRSFERWDWCKWLFGSIFTSQSTDVVHIQCCCNHSGAAPIWHSEQEQQSFAFSSSECNMSRMHFLLAKLTSHMICAPTQFNSYNFHFPPE